MLFITAVTSAAQSKFPYNLEKTDKKIILPTILNEVSGITDIDLHNIACVQDELGSVFIFNLKTEKIVSEHKFDKMGDYEGLSFTGKALYVLRSDGQLIEWVNFMNVKDYEKVKKYNLPLMTTDNEGLGYDSKKNRLLISAKNKPLDKGNKNERYIYEFDLIKKKLAANPVYTINIKELEEFVEKNNIETETKKGKKKNRVNFFPSSLAVHPKTQDIYILSATSEILVVINQRGDIIHVETLDEKQFPQAEGITFTEDGTMIISNEAAGKEPTLLIFKSK